MKHCHVLLLVAFAWATFSAPGTHAQAIPAARRGGEIRAGVAYSNGSSDEVTKRIGGFTAYGSYNLLPHLDLVGEANLLQFWTPEDYGQRTFLGGGRIFYRKQRYEPYLKFLGGLGQSITQEPYVSIRGITVNPGAFGVFAGGGGLDIRVANSFIVRAVDFEKQVWPSFSPGDLSPSILSFGVAYRIR